MRESAIERFLHERVVAVGGVTVKMAPTQRGIPDRLVILPTGAVYLIEMKAPGGRLSAAQHVWLQRLNALGAKTAVLSSRKGVREWLNGALDDLHAASPTAPR